MVHRHHGGCDYEDLWKSLATPERIANEGNGSAIRFRRPYGNNDNRSFWRSFVPDALASSCSPVGGRTAWWFAAFPPTQWLPAYRREWLTSDVIAGVTLAAYAVPVSLAYASLAGLPPQHGIFCYTRLGRKWHD